MARNAWNQEHQRAPDGVAEALRRSGFDYTGALFCGFPPTSARIPRIRGGARPPDGRPAGARPRQKVPVRAQLSRGSALLPSVRFASSDDGYAEDAGSDAAQGIMFTYDEYPASVPPRREEHVKASVGVENRRLKSVRNDRCPE